MSVSDYVGDTIGSISFILWKIEMNWPAMLALQASLSRTDTTISLAVNLTTSLLCHMVHMLILMALLSNNSRHMTQMGLFQMATPSFLRLFPTSHLLGQFPLLALRVRSKSPALKL